MIIRGIAKNSPGNVHWSIAPLVNDSVLVKELIRGPYKKPALIPSSPWLWNKKPKIQPVTIEIVEDEVIINQDISRMKKFNKWIVYYRYSKEWNYKILPSSITHFSVNILEDSNNPNLNRRLIEIGTSVVDRFGNESEVIIYDDFSSMMAD